MRLFSGFSLLGAATAMLLAVPQADAAILIASESHDFNDGTLGPFDDIDDSGTGTEVGVISDGSNWFGEGTSNQAAQVRDTSGSNNTRLGNNTASNLPSLFTLAFDYYEPSTGGNNDAVIRTGSSTLSDDTAIDFRLNDGAIKVSTSSGTVTSASAYSTNAEYRFTLVVNDSGSTQSNGNGGTVANNSIDVFMTAAATGTTIQVVDNGGFRNNGITDDFFYFATFGGDTQEFYVDNIELYDGAFTIPEPASLALVALGGVCLFGRGRRRS